MSYAPRLQDKYKSEVVPALMEQYQYSSIMQVPKIVKICLNQGVGAATQDKKIVDSYGASGIYSFLNCRKKCLADPLKP